MHAKMHASLDAIKSSAAPNTLLQVIGAAQSGKTETLRKRVCHLIENGTDPKEILILTLTGGSAELLARSLEDVRIETFGSFCSSIVNSADPGWRTLEKLETQVVRTLLGSKKIRSDKKLEMCIDLTEAQDLAKECDISLESATRFTRFLASAKILSHKGLIDKAVELAETSSLKFKVVVVDNFEEVSPQLCQLLSLVTKDSHLTIAYDREQAIYGFLGANPDQFNETSIQSLFPFMSSESVVLEKRYHSDELISTAGDVLKGTITPLALPSKEKELEWIVEKIKTEKDINLGDMAIICFTNLQADQARHHLEKEGIPCQKISSAPAWTKSLLFQVVNYLRCIEGEDLVAKLCSVSFIKGIKSETLHQLASGELLKNKKISDFSHRLTSLKESSPEWENDPQRILQVALEVGAQYGLKDHVYKTVTTSNEMAQIYQRYIDDIYTTLCLLKPTGKTLLQDFLQNYSKTFNQVDNNFVSVSTVHAAKYFHFKGVFITGTPPFGADNKQVLYTGFTRASRFVHWTRVNPFPQSYRTFRKLVRMPVRV